MKAYLLIYMIIAVYGCAGNPDQDLPREKVGERISCQDDCEVAPPEEKSGNISEPGAIKKTGDFIGGVVVWTVAVPVLLVSYVVFCPFSDGGNSFC